MSFSGSTCGWNDAGGDRNWNRSWPLCAATSELAVAYRSALLMWSTVTLTSFFSPHCFVQVLSNHVSYAGTKWAHWRIFRSPFSCLCAYLSGPANRCCRSPSAPNMPTAKAPAAPRLSRSPRLRPPRSVASSASAIFPPFDRVLTERAAGESLDETVEERVVEQRQRDARDQRRRHQRLPEEDVAANQVVRNAGGERALAGRR